MISLNAVYPGTLDYHFLFPTIYHRAEDNCSIEMLSSPDGIHWFKVPGNPVVTGDPETFDEGCLFTSCGLVPLGPDLVGLPYQRSCEGGKCPAVLLANNYDCNYNDLRRSGMDFEWDEQKNQANIAKHGISFERAQRIFEGMTVDQVDDRQDYGEERIISLGMIEAILILVVVHTDRNGATRIISARPARRSERKIYEEAIRQRTDY